VVIHRHGKVMMFWDGNSVLVQGKLFDEFGVDRQHIIVFSVVLDTDFLQMIGFTFFLPVVAGIG
jgi:hypothetical protein